MSTQNLKITIDKLQFGCCHYSVKSARIYLRPKCIQYTRT